MSINYGPSTKDYLKGLETELADLNVKAPDFEDRKKLITTEIDAAKKNLKAEADELAAAEAAE